MPAPFSLPKKRDQILQRPAEAIDGPSRDHVEFAVYGCLQQAIECRSPFAAFGATDFRPSKPLRPPSLPALASPQATGVGLDSLLAVAGRDAEIECNALRHP
jgi:hypothetical protein